MRHTVDRLQRAQSEPAMSDIVIPGAGAQVASPGTATSRVPSPEGRRSWLPLFLTAARLTGAATGFVTQILLARALLPDALGVFYSVTSAAAVIGLIAAQGYPSISARFVGRYRERGKPELAAGFLRQAHRDIACSTLLAVAALGLFGAFWPGLATGTRYAVLAATISVPAIVSLRLHGSMAAAMRRMALAFLPDVFFRGFLLLFGIALLVALVAHPTASMAVLVLTIVSIAMALAQYLVLRRGLPNPVSATPASARMVSMWRKQAIPLVVAALIINLFSDVTIIIVTPLLQSADVAAFGLCLKLAFLTGFAVQAAHQVVQPDLAEAHARKDRASVKAALLRCITFPLVVTIVATVAAALWGDLFLGVFGPEFTDQKTALAILMGCQILRAAFGPSTLLISIVGAQNANSGLALFAVAVLGTACAILAPLYGVLGASVAVLIATFAWLTASAMILMWIGRYRTDLFHLVAP